MQLSKRLEAVASLVDGKSIIDVGCDHGYLSIYLTLKGINCLATDISAYCITKAINNFKLYNVDIKTKVTDGINGININNYDTIILSGMGTHTILKILKDKELPNSLIISSNNNIKLLRKEVIKLGFYIQKELYVKENNHKYIIIKFVKGNKEYSEMDYLIGPILKNNQEYVSDYEKECISIIKKINNPRNKKQLEYEQILKYIKAIKMS